MKEQPTLSISLLVSNRKDTIERCLNSLKPLTQAIPCEIIVVDTGSTDGSIEIVKRYTDKIIKFPWCNDFSAARNAGLKEAVGEWFMFIDDDEWFEDVQEIIDFFEKKESEKYGRLCYRQRNYLSFDENARYSETAVGRMSIRTEELHFEGTVHEYLWPLYGEIKYVNSFVHHYGHAFKTEEDKKAHAKRNITLLLKDLEKEPKDIRNLAQLAQEYLIINDNEMARETIEKGIQIAEKTKQTEPALAWLYAKKADVYVRTGQTEQLKQYARDCENRKDITELGQVNIYASALQVLFREREDILGVEYGKKYLELAKWLERNEEQKNEQNFMNLEQVIGLDNYVTAQTMMIGMYVRQGMWLDAWKEIEQVKWEAKSQNTLEIFAALFDVAEKAGTFGRVKDVINHILETEDVAGFSWEEYLTRVTEQAKRKVPERAEGIIDLFLGVRQENSYVLLQKFLSAMRQGNKTDMELYLRRYEKLPFEKQNSYGDFVWLALEQGLDAAALMKKLDAGYWKALVDLFKEVVKTEDVLSLIEKLETQLGQEDERYQYARMILLQKRIEDLKKML